MLLQATSGVPRSAHVIVLGNEKGGSGKSTTAMHIAVSLLKAGQRVATIDLDSRQQTFTHYVENRRATAKRSEFDQHVNRRVSAAYDGDRLSGIARAVSAKHIRNAGRDPVSDIFLADGR